MEEEWRRKEEMREREKDEMFRNCIRHAGMERKVRKSACCIEGCGMEGDEGATHVYLLSASIIFAEKKKRDFERFKGRLTGRKGGRRWYLRDEGRDGGSGE